MPFNNNKLSKDISVVGLKAGRARIGNLVVSDVKTSALNTGTLDAKVVNAPQINTTSIDFAANSACGPYTLYANAERNQFLVKDACGETQVLAQFDEPQLEAPWPMFGGPIPPGNSIQTSTDITSSNVSTLTNVANAKIGQLPGWRVDSFAGVTVDDSCVYMNVYNNFLPSDTTALAPIQSPSGALICVDKKTGTVKWRRAISSYTGVVNDYSRAAPAMHGDYLFFGTNLFSPQTYNPLNPAELTSRFGAFGAQIPTARGEPPSLVAVNKYTGELHWTTRLGNVASRIDDDDNWLSCTGSPVVFETNFGLLGGETIPVVVMGTSSAQSFSPFFINRGIDVAGNPLSIGDYPDFRMTDRGRVYLVHAVTGQILKTTYVLPSHLSEVAPPYAGPNPVPASAVSADGYASVLHHYMTADSAAGGELNPVVATGPYDNPTVSTNTVVWTLTQGQAVPPCLIALNPYIVNQTTQVITDVATMGGVVTADFHRSVVRVDGVKFLPGTNTFNMPAPDVTVYSIPANFADSSDPAVVYGTRIWKNMKVGDSMSAQDAYDLNYYGSSTWGNSPSIYYSSTGEPLYAFVTCGQMHHGPIDDARVIYNQPGTLPFVNRMQLLKVGADTSLAAFQAAKTAELAYLAAERTARETKVSARGQSAWFDGFVCLDLSVDSFGDLVPANSFRTLGVDVWEIRQSFDMWGQTTAGTTPVAIQRGFSSLSDLYGQPRGADGDFVSGVAINPGPGGGTVVAGCSKYGLVAGFTLDATHTPTAPFWQLVGIPGIEGGSQFGICSDASRLYSTQRNTQTIGRTSAVPDNTIGAPASYVQSLLNWAPFMSWRTASDQVVPPGTSFLSAWDYITQTTAWEAIGPSPVGSSYYQFSTCPTCTDSLVILQEGDGVVRIRDSATGVVVHSFLSTDSLGNPTVGNSQIAIDQDSLYVLSARTQVIDNVGFDNPNAISSDQMMIMRLP